MDALYLEAEENKKSPRKANFKAITPSPEPRTWGARFEFVQ
jgi:hypothetical protein